MIGRGDKCQGLYEHNATDMVGCSAANWQPPLSVNSVSATIWHNPLGHLSHKQPTVLMPQVHCNDFDCYQNSTPFYICPLAKHRRLSFVAHNHLSQYPFDLVHCDVWGPYHVTSVSGY